MTLTWVPKSAGRGRWYETACGRFSLSRAGYAKGAGWTLTDRHNQDSVVPQYLRMETSSTIRAGKAKAERWVRAER